jgi:hypothetical protein
MTALGWIFLTLSMAFVWGLTIWCYAKLLRAPKPPAHEIEEFHNA